MSWSCGIVGQPNAGKSSLFKAITAHDVTIENYPFSTVDPNKAVVALPDRRLSQLARLSGSSKITPASIEVIDIAGLVRGASRGEGLGNQFLGQLRNTDLLIHVIGAFAHDGVSEKELSSMAADVNTELLLADLEAVARRREKAVARLKGSRESASAELDFLERLTNNLNRGLPARSLNLPGGEEVPGGNLFLLTAKEMFYAVNLNEEDLAQMPAVGELDQCPCVFLSARLEAELSEIPLDDKRDFLEAYSLQEGRVAKLLEACSGLLRLISFYTVKGEEARAWLAPKGISAVKAAGKVHSDMEKGFINAEVISWEELLAAGSFQCAKDKGVLRTEGRSYEVGNGDVMQFRFKV